MPNGEKTDVVLGFETLEDYLNSFNLASAPYFGTVVGRFAGRINNGSFSIVEKNYQLEKNHGNNHLHGGKKGMSKAVWRMIKQEQNSLCFEHTSFAFEDNYPGELKVQVSYLLTENNELKIYPNPFKDEFSISNSAASQYEIYDLSGKLVLKGAIQNGRVTATQIPKGIYLLKIKMKDGTFITKKLMKQ